MIRDRFAPSPTGNVHVGSLRTALYNYLFAKKNNGQFLLRLEDTDRTRYEEGAVENLLGALMVTGVVPDEGLFEEDGKIVQKGDYGPYIQSERLEIYKKYIDQLLENGQAYYCFCTKERLDEVREKQKRAAETPRYDGHCRNLPREEVEARVAAGEPYVIRLKLPEDHVVTFDDAVRGRIEINTNDLDDQVLIKPTVSNLPFCRCRRRPSHGHYPCYPGRGMAALHTQACVLVRMLWLGAASVRSLIQHPE